MNRQRMIIIALVLAFALTIAAGLIYKRSLEISNASKPQTAMTPVRIAAAKSGSISIGAHYLGKVESAMSTELSARITASVLAVFKREGDTVAAGEILLELDDMTLANKTRASIAELRSAQSALLAAESSYQTQKSSSERSERLYKQSAIALETMERSKSATDVAVNQVTAAQERIRICEENYQISVKEQGYARITAPFAGVITRRQVEPGDLALPGKSLVTLQAVNQGYKITVPVPQDAAAIILAGAETVLSDGVRTLTAPVTKVHPALAAANLATVEIRLQDLPWSLPLGSSIGVDIVTSRVSGVIIPLQALVSNSKGDFVVVVEENDLVRQMPVRVMGRNSEAVAVSGIADNSRVVIGQENRLMQLTNGKKVMVISDGSENN